jgi:N-acetylglucosamine-6-sulfatase
MKPSLVFLRIAALVLVLSTASCSRDATPHERGQRPDIVFILTDDQRFDALSCAGNKWIQTPNLDRLAREGAYFENSFVVSPICSPSRASILTGMYGHVTGVLSTKLAGDVLAGHALFPELLQKQGYETAFIGKWHLPDPDAKPYRGFDHWVSFEGQGRYVDQPLDVDGEAVQKPGYLADVLTDYAVEWLKKPRDKPFFLMLSFKNPHFPYQPAPRHRGLLANAPITLPESSRDSPESEPAFLRSIRASPRMIKLPEESRAVVETVRVYLETVLSVDDDTGRVLDTLAGMKKLDSTFVLMTSDNGLLFGEHGLVQKNRSYEESIRVPLLVRFPAEISAGLRVKQSVLNIDLAPTFLDIAGATVPKEMQGRSLRPLWRGGSAPWREAALFIEPPQTGNTNPAALALRTSRWKYVRYRSRAIEEALFDLEHDPAERKDLAGDAAAAPALEALRVGMRTEMERLGVPRAWWEPFTPEQGAVDDEN